jgi:hypothetical protein
MRMLEQVCKETFNKNQKQCRQHESDLDIVLCIIF